MTAIVKFFQNVGQRLKTVCSTQKIAYDYFSSEESYLEARRTIDGERYRRQLDLDWSEAMLQARVLGCRDLACDSKGSDTDSMLYLTARAKPGSESPNFMTYHSAIEGLGSKSPDSVTYHSAREEIGSKSPDSMTYHSAREELQSQSPFSVTILSDREDVESSSSGDTTVITAREEMKTVCRRSRGAVSDWFCGSEDDSLCQLQLESLMALCPFFDYGPDCADVVELASQYRMRYVQQFLSEGVNDDDNTFPSAQKATREDTTTYLLDPDTTTYISASDTTTCLSASDTTTCLLDPDTTTHLSASDTTTCLLDPDTTTYLSDPDTTTCLSDPDRTTYLSGPDTTTYLLDSDRTTYLSDPDTTTYLSDPNATTCLSDADTTACLLDPDRTTYLSDPDTATCLLDPDRSTYLSDPDMTTCLSDPHTITCLWDPDTITCLWDQDTTTCLSDPDTTNYLSMEEVVEPMEKQVLSDIERLFTVCPSLARERPKRIDVDVWTARYTENCRKHFSELHESTAHLTAKAKAKTIQFTEVASKPGAMAKLSAEKVSQSAKKPLDLESFFATSTFMTSKPKERFDVDGWTARYTEKCRQLSAKLFD